VDSLFGEFFFGDLLGLVLSGMNGVNVYSYLVGDYLTDCYFLGEFSLDSFLPNSFVGERLFNFDKNYDPKVSG